MLQFKGANKTTQRQIISDTRLMAQKHTLNANYIEAIECYSDLINMLSAYKSKEPCELGNAYRDFAAANFSVAGRLIKTEPQKAELHKAQGILQIQQAILSYPSTATQELTACKAQLTNLTAFPTQHVDHENENIDIEELSADVGVEADIDVEALSSVEEMLKEKPAVLHWKKALLQRYIAEQNAVNNALKVDESNQRVAKFKA